MADKTRHYYEARGFSVYYFANAVFNVVKHSGDYLRGIEEILGDMQVLTLMRPFHQFTNLHHFLEAIIGQIVEKELQHLDEDSPRFLMAFLTTYGVPHSPGDLESQEDFYTFASESQAYGDALDALVDEVFHVFFNDIRFLQEFNELCADYIELSGFGAELTTQAGTLKRVPIPVWARRAIFHRDKGECRECKRSLTAVLNRLETERYDHIVPLAKFGANDVTNLQLLCEPCNLKKAAGAVPVSPLYPRAFSPK